MRDFTAYLNAWNFKALVTTHATPCFLLDVANFTTHSSYFIQMNHPLPLFFPPLPHQIATKQASTHIPKSEKKNEIQTVMNDEILKNLFDNGQE